MRKILIAEDDRRISDFIERGLRAASYTCLTVDDGASALLLARSGEFDMLILDIGLPTLSGFEVLERLRSEGSRTPVIVLTASDSVADTVYGLESGANDYMTKPFQFAELLARIRLRLQDDNDPVPVLTLTHGDMVLDLRSRRVHCGDDVADLTAREFSLLEVFLRHPGQVLTREQLISHAWDMDFDPASNVVDVYVRALRGKVGAARLETVRGAGYRLL
ncbi:transcriptional regulator [Arthrobacter sp. ZBG10]|uniref:response regulator transcription factor n=1 Tax=Micrococcaceae TaxID=1268 RepID=UPI000682E351|nr:MULTISPECIES: response regulator transcription factor [Micrococcaceae]KNH21629.1 transcriptional regulator [Arthrobacter sp. ZBG10]KQR02779.1 two-component system response regulator [Arthrobacter sp. Leaf141]